MGLDMYLYIHAYKSKSPYDKNPKVAPFYPEELKDFEDDIFQRNFISVETDYQVGYWRKFNALHGYIVNNFADGVDECQKIYLGSESINQIIDVCDRVLKNRYDIRFDDEKIKEILPPVDGFFFGSTEINDRFFEEVQYTLELFKKVRQFITDHQYTGERGSPIYEVVYQASW